jgi:hypothetical protein
MSVMTQACSSAVTAPSVARGQSLEQSLTLLGLPTLDGYCARLTEHAGGQVPQGRDDLRVRCSPCRQPVITPPCRDWEGDRVQRIIAASSGPGVVPSSRATKSR